MIPREIAIVLEGHWGGNILAPGATQPNFGMRAFGRFEVTQDVSRFTKARFLQPGARVETAVRFSTVAGERGSPDTWRDPRGFSVKFYTEDGNFDMVGNNTPIFFIRDPTKVQHFIRSQKRQADNGLRDHDLQWDFWTLSPESAHQVTPPPPRRYSARPADLRASRIVKVVAARAGRRDGRRAGIGGSSGFAGTVPED